MVSRIHLIWSTHHSTIRTEFCLQITSLYSLFWALKQVRYHHASLLSLSSIPSFVLCSILCWFSGFSLSESFLLLSSSLILFLPFVMQGLTDSSSDRLLPLFCFSGIGSEQMGFPWSTEMRLCLCKLF
uniref:Uncharacterized protein n=1 Tax=Musa acuminata subsp. malaccensis TaxID=214687 RepID=A0A804JJY7_MUSAM